MAWNEDIRKQMIRTAAVSAGVYLLFRYCLLWILPFLLAFFLAALLRPLNRWLKSKLHLPATAAAGISICLFLALIGYFSWKLLGLVFRQAMALIRLLPVWLEDAVCRLEGVCCRLEQQFRLQPGLFSGEVRDFTETTGKQLSETCLSFAMNGSFPVLKTLIGFGVAAAVTVLAAVLLLSREQEYRDMFHKLPFQEELSLLGGRLKKLGGSWLRCELLAMLLTSLICVAGIWLTGNEYALLLGLLIGVLDALPLIGTGTVLLPWALFTLLGGRPWQALILILTYGISDFLRQVLETHMLGKTMGSSPLITLGAMYGGMKLFGLAGLLLGPAALLLIREILRLWQPEEKVN